jgi:hypothetical protein
MNILIDDEFEELEAVDNELSKKEFNDLKKFIATLVRGAGGKLALSDVVIAIRECEEPWKTKVCEYHIVAAAEENQKNWDEKRALKKQKGK